MKKEGLRDHTRREMFNLGQNLRGEDEKSEKRVFGVRDIFSIQRKREK